MAKREINVQSIPQEWSATGVASKVKGGALASQTSRDGALFSQMRILPHGARTLLSCGLQGQTDFVVISGTNPNNNASKVYPSKTSSRVMGRAKCRLTPGYTLQARAIFAPSGPVQTSTVDGGGKYQEDVATAYVQIDVTIDNGISNTSGSVKLVPKWSMETYKSLPSGAGAVWNVLNTATKSFPFPEFKTADWVEGVSVTITITAVGGARPVDVAVIEIPYWAVHDDTSRECTIPLIPFSGVPAEFAITGKSYTGDPRWGSHQASKSMRDYRKVVGPLLMSWSCWNEDVATITSTEGTAKSTSSTAFVDILYSGTTSWAATNPGWSLSSGGTARNLEQAGPLELRGKNGVIPVICRAYCKIAAGGTLTVRFQSEGYSLVDLTTTSSTYTWVSGLAWLRCGTHQTDFSNLQVLCKSSGIGFAGNIQYLSVEYFGNYIPVE